MQNILIIKHSALGDFVLASGAMHSIRAHHPQARLTLLTTPLFAEMSRVMGIFDEVLIDARPKFWQIGELKGLKRRLNSGYDRIYDLQVSDRTAFYHRFLLADPKPEWVGHAKGCSHFVEKDMTKHAFQRHRGQLAAVGIQDTPLPDLTGLTPDVADFDLPEKYALLVPGGAPHRPQKRWPAEHYRWVSRWLADQEITPVLIGTKADAGPIDDITDGNGSVVDLSGKTSLLQLAGVAKGAEFALGNDTGPMHIVGATQTPCVVLFSNDSRPEQSAPLGDHIHVLQEDDLNNLSVELVTKTLGAFV